MISKSKLRNFIIALGNSADRLHKEREIKSGFLEKGGDYNQIVCEKTQTTQKTLLEEDMKKWIKKYENEIKRMLRDSRADLKFYAEHRIDSIKIEKDTRKIYEKIKKLYEDIVERKAAEEKKIELKKKILENQRDKKIREIKEIIKNIELQYSIIGKKLKKKQRERIKKRIKRLKLKIAVLLNKHSK